MRRNPFRFLPTEVGPARLHSEPRRQASRASTTIFRSTETSLGPVRKETPACVGAGEDSFLKFLLA
jgi:hypothetical protein